MGNHCKVDHRSSIMGKTRLLMELDDNDCANYQVILQTVGGREIFTTPGWQSQIGKDRVFATLPVKAGEFTKGDYVLIFPARPQTVEVKSSTNTSTECRKKNIPTKIKKATRFCSFSE